MSDQAAPGVDLPPRHRRPLAPFVALAVAAVFAALFWVLAGARAGTDETADTPLLDRPAPSARSTTVNGDRFDLAQRKGSWVVLNFFNSTCVPCVQEHPDLVAFVGQQRQLGAEGAELYSIVWDQDEADAASFFAENGGDWPVVLDDDGSIAVAFGVAQVPETWIISPEGYVVGRYINTITADELGDTLQQLRDTWRQPA